MSSPRVAFSAISSADRTDLDIFGIASLLLFGRFPGRDKVIVLAFHVTSDLKNHGTKAITAPSYRTKLFRIVTFLVNEVNLVENLLSLFQTDTMLPLDGQALRSVEV